jgi:YD repeat-containing protein
LFCPACIGRINLNIVGGLAGSLDAADLAGFTYAYNAVGSITQIGEPAASDRNFGYDALQRLVSGGTAAAPESYSYDAEGNRLVSCQSAWKRDP